MPTGAVYVEGSAAGERTSDILARARAAGFTLSARQLKRWHSSDLIPRPSQLWDKGIPGSDTIYPPGTGDQLLVLCAICQRVRRSKDRGWMLWWLGFSVDEPFWKDILIKSAGWYDRTIPKILKLLGPDNETENSQNWSWLLTKLRTVRIRNVLFRQLRKRLGPIYFDEFIGIIIDILEGQFEQRNAAGSLDDDDLIRDKIMIDKGLGLSRFRSVEQLKKDDNAHLYDDAENALRLLSSRLGGVRLTEVLSACSDEQIFYARNEMRGLLAVAELASSSNPKKGKDQLGLKVLAKFAGFKKMKIHRLCILYFLALKEDAAFQRNLDQFFDDLRKAILPPPNPAQITTLRRQDPALAEIMFPPTG
jgi:hypothetical protein